MDTDRNLLFAVLALQADLIDRDRFVRACTLWAAHKERAIADLLLEQGWLTFDGKAVVDQLIAFKLRKHGGDVQASLAEAAGADVRGALASIPDADVERSVAALPDTPARPTRVAPAAEDFSTVPPAACAGRNILYEEIGCGGIGRVLRGRDAELRRDLAVKVLRDEYRNDAKVQRRFVEEAQISGQLQHPGVVPIHELGRFPDGQPYFTMKLVKGRTLAALLNEHPDPGQDLSRFLTIFQQVCQTVAYAHSKGVIHRDLKPANIMVGAFGEVQVMDWGLAKVLTTEGGDAEATTARTVIRTVRAGSTTDEDGGTGVVGTPAYMAPQQARGEIGTVDKRADVFGLGAILCVILTGRPPFVGDSREQVLRLAAAGDLAEAFARLAGCQADRELVALCQACLAPEREDRPADASVLATRLAAYQAAVEARLRRRRLRVRRARLRRAAALARAASERRARRRTRALAVTLLALVVVGAGAGLLLQRQAQREGEQRQAVAFALEKAVVLREQSRWREAAAVLEQARQGLGAAGPDDLRQRLEGAAADLALVKRLDAIRQRRAGWVEDHFDNETAERDYAAAFEETGLGKPADDEAVVAEQVRTSAVAGPLVAALDDWASIAKAQESRRWLVAVARLADPDPWRDRVRKIFVQGERQLMRALADEALGDGGARIGELSPQLLEAMAAYQGYGADAVPLLRAARRRYPSDFWLNLHLANALCRAKQFEEAVGYDQAAVALRPDAAAAHNNLGRSLNLVKRRDEAIAEYRKAVEIDPRLAYAHANLGHCLAVKHEWDEAIIEHRKAIDINPKYARAYTQLGLTLLQKGDLDAAIEEHRKAIDMDPKSAGTHRGLGLALAAKDNLEEAISALRKAIDIEPKSAESHHYLGLTLHAKGDLDGAVAEERKAIEIDPSYAKAYHGLGSALQAKGDLTGAVAAYCEAIKLDPKDAEAHHGLASALQRQGASQEAIAALRIAIALDPSDAKNHRDLGIVLGTKKALDEAIVSFRRAIALDSKDAKSHSGLGSALLAKRDLEVAIAEFRQAIAHDSKYAESHVGLGQALFVTRDFEAAIAEFRKAIALDPKSVLAHVGLASTLIANKDVDGAIATYRQLIALVPKDARAQNDLGRALALKQDLDGAIAAYRKAIALDPSLAIAHYNLGVALATKKDLDGAIAECRKAITLDPGDARSHYTIGMALRNKGTLEAAVAECRRAIDLAPSYAEAHCGLGSALCMQGLFAEALVELRRGHELSSQSPDWPQRSAELVRQCERLVELDRRLQGALAGAAEPANAAERLALAHLCQQFKRRHTAAARFYGDAFAADPRLVAELRQQHRYNAACSAARAGTGQGEDAKNLPDKVRLALRLQALRWLCDDLTAYVELAKRDDPSSSEFVRHNLAHWQQDADLALVRDPRWLYKLPYLERLQWRQLWDDVAVLLNEVEEKK
jgi:serine/threonine-protein kinase